MKKIVHILLLGMLLAALPTHAQTDSVDILHYDIHLDIDHNAAQILQGRANITLLLQRTMPTFTLDLKQAVLDSLLLNGQPLTDISYAQSLLTIPSSGINPGDTTQLTIFYHTGGYVESYGWGGFHMDNNIHYNLGVAFNEYPHNFGRSWYPCRDNFHDKATYDLTATTKPGWSALCSGELQSTTTNDDNSTTSHWNLSLPTPTYLVSVAVAPFSTIQRNYQGLYGTYPATIGYLNHDSTRVYQAYDILEDVIPMYERCFGPYRWGRIGYVSTPKGSMEHANNIALVSSCMANTSVGCQSVICHELSHAWFGNLVTCATSLDMWFNEGGASFCEEIAMEAAFGPAYAKEFATDNLEAVLRTTHITDDGYKPLYGQTPEYTYGSTVYDKGAIVWHTIRGYLGDSLFYTSMQRLFNNMAFSNITSTQLRDSLSLYTGQDLTDLFDFHVFGPGFQDFRIDRMEPHTNGASINIRQQLVGTDTYANSNRLPITFFDNQLNTATRTIEFDGAETQQEVQLPFTPTLAIVDLAGTLSKASITDTLMPYKKGVIELPSAHFKTNVKKVDSTTVTLLSVTHHWTSPDPSANTGHIRLAKRYWTVDGIIPSGTSMNGMFRYSKAGGSATYANLDLGFYQTSSTLDSIQLLYRQDSSHPWNIVKSQCNGNSNEGFFVVNNLKKGEYTLAVIDSSMLDIQDPIQEIPNTPAIEILPNPNKDCFTLHLILPGNYTIVIRDLKGRRILTRRGISSQTTISHNLPAGIYFVEIKDKNHTIQVEKMAITNF